MKIFPRVAVAALSLSLLATAAFAAETYKFKIINNTTKYTITGFQTYEKGQWDNWNNVTLAPGETLDMDWGSNEGSCVVPFRVLYADVQTEQYQVDWCKVHNIIVTDTSVTYN